MEVSKFFAGKDQVFKSLRRIVRRLQKASIPYAVVGGMAVFAHKYRRTTNDVDILVTAAGLKEFKKQFVPKDYATIPGRPRRFVDRRNRITVDLLVTGFFPGSGKPGPISYPDPEDVAEIWEKIHVVDLITLVELKLAARRHRDFGDVVELIRFNELDEAFAQKLHKSVRGDYTECLEEKRREDEYEARQ